MADFYQPKPTYRKIDIVVVEHGSNRVAGGFCSTMDAVSEAELQALAALKKLRAEADQVKVLLSVAENTAQKATLNQRLATLRQEAAVWRAKREEATREKHVALGHVTVPLK